MFEDFAEMPMVRDITYITIQPANKEKAKWAEPLKDIPAIAYLVVAIKAKTEQSQDPNTTDIMCSIGGNIEEMEAMREALDQAIMVRPQVTRGRRGLYQVEIPDNKPVTTIRPEKKEGLITRFIKWLI